MEERKEARRFINKSEKNSISDRGYKLYVSPAAQQQIDQFDSGHNRSLIDKSIQRLAASPRPRSAGQPIVLKGSDHYRLRNDCCLIDYQVSPGTVLVTRVVVSKMPGKSGKIVVVKGDVHSLPEPTGLLLTNVRFWEVVARAEGRMGHFRASGNRPNNVTGAAIYRDNQSFTFDDVCEEAARGWKYGTKSIIGDFAGNSRIPIEGAVSVVVSHPKWENIDYIEKYGAEVYRQTAETTNALVLVGSRGQERREYVVFHTSMSVPAVIRDERE